MVLGDILPIAYDLRSGQKDLQRELRRLECALDEWEASLPEHLHLGSNVAFSRVSASCNLRFCYLSIKVLLCRIALRVSPASSISQYTCTISELTISRPNQELNKPATRKSEHTA